MKTFVIAASIMLTSCGMYPTPQNYGPRDVEKQNPHYDACGNLIQNCQGSNCDKLCDKGEKE